MVYSAAAETGSRMTTQDWLPGLETDEEQSGTPTARRRRWLLAGVLVTVLALGAVVVEVIGLTTAERAGSTAPAPSANVAPETPAARPVAGPVVIEADLTDPGVTDGLPVGPLVIAEQPLQGGSAPNRVPNFDTCQADASMLQYLPVQIGLPEDWLSATVEVQTTASTPPGVGRLGFFFQAGRESTPCPDGAWPTSDHFLANLHQPHIVGYVVLDQAFSPSTPQGRADVFRTLQLRVSDVELSGRLATIGPPTVGSLCPGSQDELCARLSGS
jgi:hypothetical protein